MKVVGDFLQSATGVNSESRKLLSSSEDGLISSAHAITRALLLTDTSLSEELGTAKHEKDLTVSFSSPEQAGVPLEQGSLVEILLMSCQSNPHAKKLLESSLFCKLLYSGPQLVPVSKSSSCGCISISEEEAKALLDHSVTTLSPACAKMAGLLMERSKLLLDYFTSHCISKLCKVSLCDLELCQDDNEMIKVHSYFYMMSQFFKALSSLDMDGTQRRDICNHFMCLKFNVGRSEKSHGDVKSAVKLVRKRLVDKCLHMLQIIEDTPALSVSL